jgi:Mce-associated membrane protein
MRGSVFDSPAVLEPAGHATDVDMDAEGAVYPQETAPVSDQSVTKGSEPRSTRRRLNPGARLRAVLVSGGLLALILLLVAGGFLYQQRSVNTRLDDTRAEVVGVARQEAVNLMSLSYNTAQKDLDRILSLATGSVAKQFESQRKTINSYLGQAKSTSRAQVKSAGLVSLGKDRAVVLVGADATVSNNEATNAGAKSVVKHYRMSVTLQRVHGQWRVSDVGFDGAAQ